MIMCRNGYNVKEIIFLKKQTECEISFSTYGVFLFQISTIVDINSRDITIHIEL